MLFFLLFLSIFLINNCISENEQIINLYINEELPLSTRIFTITNNITYRLFHSTRNHNSFIYYNISNGDILIVNLIDREYLCSKYICSCIKCQLIIELIEWKYPYHILKIILNIEDINDHIPIFSSDNYQLNIIENIPIGFELLLESAYDADLGENSRINYELKSNNKGPFKLIHKNNDELILKVINKIDREEKDFYQYELIAFNNNGQLNKQSSTKLFIKIDDMNDNPVILSTTYIQLNISENTPIGTELIFINATDKDIGINGKIHYSISNGYSSDHFSIGNSNGILTLINSLDYEIEQYYRLTIQVRDLGENSIASFVTIDISIIDENDNYPQAFITFVNPLINNSIISIPENISIGQILAHISIFDQDSGINSKISYKIEEGNELIGIKILDEKTFLLIIKYLINSKNIKMKINKLIISISDHGIPSKSIKLEYKINLIDLNNSLSNFNQSMKCNFNFNYPQNRSLDKPLFEIQSINLDLYNNDHMSYSILPPYDNLFLINNQGQIFNIENLNQSYYHLQIMIVDHRKLIQLNSIYNCYLSISKNKSISLINNIKIYKYYFIILLIFSFILIIFISTFYLNYQKCFKKNRTYHLYVKIPKKSLYIHNENISHHILDEFIHLNNNQLFEKT